LSGVYENPKYYEIAFSFRDIPAEVDVFEECFKRFSEIPVKSVLELGCGNSPHMEELIKRGYRYNGLDLSKAMLEYSREKALRIGSEVNLIHGDMVDFSLETKVDFVYVLLGSLCAKSTSELLTHFNSVAQVLKRGGLYLLDWCIQGDPPWVLESGGNWVLEREDIQVKTTVSWKVINRVEQTFEETLNMEVNDHGEKLNIVGKEIKKAIYPQEFLCLVSGFKHFEFVGWWNNWDFGQPLEQADKIDRPIALIRRI
jgi:SAM-dependent methyltransferase